MEYDALLSLKITDKDGNLIRDFRKTNSADSVTLSGDIRFKKDPSSEVAARVSAEFSHDLAESIFNKLSNSILVSIMLCGFTINIVIYIAIRLVCNPLNKLTSLFESGNTNDIEKIKLTKLAGRISEVSNLYNGTRVLVKKIDHYHKQLINSVKHKAISQTTQIFAHDVRKPFSMMEAILHHLETIDEPEKFIELSKKYTRHVHKALASVNGLIQDVMDMGKETKLNKEPVSPRSLIEASLCEVCGMEMDKNSYDIPIQYDFKHKSMICIDALKMQRVFSNIILNAIQASEGQGALWFYTAESHNGQYIEFCIGNSGSSIAEEDIPMLFEAFFTTKKKGGTGLGMAIAYNIVHAHGGTIKCESSVQESFVKFILTLPSVINLKDDKVYSLPENTSEIVMAYKNADIARPAGIEEDDAGDLRIFEYEKKLEHYFEKHQKRLTIAILEDDALYRNTLKNLIKNSPALKNVLNIKMFGDADSVLEYFQENRPNFFICDINLGPGSMNGLELLSILSKRKQMVPTCVHSNRSKLEDVRLDRQYSVKSLVPKPMMRVHLLKYISDSLPMSEPV
jgi:signal transduction histidine kinase